MLTSHTSWLPTTMVGSYPRPAWYRHQLHGQHLLHALKLEEHREAYEDAVLAVIRDQEEAGLDYVTDGQMYYDDYVGSIGSMLWYWYERIDGFTEVLSDSPLNIGADASWSERAIHSVMAGTVASRKVKPPAQGSALVNMYRIAQARANRPIKFSVGALPGNLTFHVDFAAPGSAYSSPQALAEDLVPFFNDELKALVRAGCEFIQIEDLSVWTLLQGDGNRWVLDVLNGVVQGVEAKLAWHCCMGATYGNRATILDNQLQQIIEAMYEVNVDQYVLDFAHSEMREVGVLAGLPSNKEVAIGVIDVRTLQVESEDDVLDRMRKVLEVIPPQQVSFTTDCGMKAQHRFTARAKLHSLADAAARLRNEVPQPSRSA